MKAHRPMNRLAFGPGGSTSGSRELPEEVAVAISFNGSTQAVMMATPADLVEFAYGFVLTEGLASTSDITEVTPVQTEKGIDLQIWVVPEVEARLAARRRHMAGPVGCGLCGIDSIDQATRDMAPVQANDHMTPSEVMAAVSALPQFQPLHDTTRAAHAAGFWCDGQMMAVREDVGRHNALDKLAGAWLTMNDVPHGALAAPPLTGAVVLTSRVSIDMVQKVAALGQSILIAVSAPTVHAVTLADRLNITLIALARPDRFEVFTHPHRIRSEARNVA
jgi:FdhD protein